MNPYHRLERVITHFSNRLRALDISNIVVPGLPRTPEELEEQKKIWPAVQIAYTEALGLGLALKMNAPVLAECFINVLIFLLAKPELRQDERLYQSVIRQEIDIRVKTLHLHCQGFNSPVDASAQAFKGFHTMMNGRNDFLHGNIDPRRLNYEIVHFDGTVPLPDRYDDFARQAVINSLKHVEPESALRDVETVKSFIEFVLSHLDEPTRANVGMFLNTQNPGWRTDTKKVGILFPPYLVHGIPGPQKPASPT